MKKCKSHWMTDKYGNKGTEWLRIMKIMWETSWQNKYLLIENVLEKRNTLELRKECSVLGDEWRKRWRMKGWKTILNPITHCRGRIYPHFLQRPEVEKMKILLFFGQCLVNRSLSPCEPLKKHLYAWFRPQNRPSPEKCGQICSGREWQGVMPKLWS